MNRDEDVFAGALAVPAAERASFLARACEGDVVLRERVEALLNVHDASPNFLEIPLAPHNANGAERLGDKVGRYKLLQKLGEGGCGVVWMAEQEEPVRRRVALKVIKLGMDTKAVVARFEAERQALAMMDHPNIAKVHDAGATEMGRPFFVMELVRGIPITKYCDENHLTPKARLELFIKVCQAVQHAHQKGIIHRDLKPSNILVTVNDGAPTPKIIDFGIAKATQGRLTDATVFTAFEQFIGTPMYMSPEQAEMSSLDIDTRSDIYSLGVLLYELLIGKPPFDPKAFAQAGVDQIRQHIREIEPPAPSRRLHTLGEDERTTVARFRATPPAQLSLLLRGDLDWIVMRCLEKDRTRRYDTANGLAMDVQRHLRNEPVFARPPSTAYLAGKVIRRHRVGFAAAAAIAVTLAAGTIVSAWHAVRAKQAEARADTARHAEARLRQDAERQENIAREQAYAADMNLVQQALAEANLERAQSLLYRHKPRPGQRDLRGWEWRYLWPFCQPDWESVFCENVGDISSMSISGDGLWIAIAAGRLSVWNLMTRKELSTPLHGTGFTHVAFASRRPLLAAYTLNSRGGSQGRIILWNLETGNVIREISLEAQCAAVFFSEDSATLAAATRHPDNRIVLWRVSDGSELRTFSAPQKAASQGIIGTRFIATPDLTIGAHATPSGDLCVIDLTNGGERWVEKAADEGSVVATLAFSADGRLIASGANFNDSTIRIWDVASGKQIRRLEGHRGPVFDLLFWPDGKTLASASNDRTIRIWDVETGKEINLLRGHTKSVMRLALLADHKTLVSGARDGTACLWNPKSRRHQDALIKLPEPMGAWRFAKDGKSLLTARGDGRIVRWQGEGLRERTVELDVGPIVADWRMGPEQFSPDLRYVAVQPAEGKVVVWDTFTREKLREFDSARDIHPAAHFVSDETLRIFDQRKADSLRCQEWHLRSGTVLHSWLIPIRAMPGTAAGSPASPPPTVAHRSSFLGVTFSADGDRCLFSRTSGKSFVHNLRTGRNESEDLDFFAERFPQFSPDGRLLAAREVIDIKLRETGTFREVATLPTVMRMPQSVAFSPHGDRLAVGSSDTEAVILWNPRTREPVLTLAGNGAQFIRTAFSPDGSRLGSRSSILPGEDGTLHVWRAPTFEEIEAAEKRATSSRSIP
jgi:WD40 repeat protein/tRNA A-37 threonylcarbamoyl transferase component Bud32